MRLSVFSLLLVLCASMTYADVVKPSQEFEHTEADFEFFERKIRPLLVHHCFECHSERAEKLKGGLRLDRLDAVRTGGDSGPALVAGNPEESLLIEAVRYQGSEMPPTGKLKDEQIEALVRWVAIGAPWPESTATRDAGGKAEFDWPGLQQQHWAFQPIVLPRLPPVSNPSWAANEIDRFILHRLDQAELSPNKRASRRTLIRRAYFDLVGLPPTPQQVDDFLEDNRHDAYRRLIDRLLDSPRYGERWGRYWLDLARYSDGRGGFNDGAAMPHAYHYRDWVIHQLNQDLPYDEFVRQQIAGDQIDADEAFVGTGFFAIGPAYKSDGGDPDSVAQAKSETLDDRVDTMSRALLGLTVACARCHDHKFDPIPTLDYYSLAGVFENTKVIERPLVEQTVVDRYNAAQAAVAKVEKEIKQLNDKAKRAQEENRELPGDDQELLADLRARKARLAEAVPPKFATSYALEDTGSKNMTVALRGDIRKIGPEAPRRFLRIVAGESPTPFETGSGRLELAEAIVDPANPLTARVIVNRVWQYHMGKGLVRSPSNFGKLGEPPTHPLLLDWLAAEFVEHGSSLKWLHRKIMLSSTYRMSSRFQKEAFAKDGDNRWLWRMTPRRLDVEAWRDSLLAVSDELDARIGGPPIDVLDSRRRTIYGKVSRSGDAFESDGFLRLFDFPTPRASQPLRVTSTVPQQFLFMLNSHFFVERARSLAGRLRAEVTGYENIILRAYQLLYNRDPTSREWALGVAFLSQPDSPNEKLTSLEKYAQVLLSANEFMHWE